MSDYNVLRKNLRYGNVGKWRHECIERTAPSYIVLLQGTVIQP